MIAAEITDAGSDQALIARHPAWSNDDDAPAYTLLRDAWHEPCSLDHDWRVRPGTQIVNPATGEVTVVPEPLSYRGGDLTVGQLAKRLEMGPRKTRAALVDLGILHGESEVKMVPMVSDPMQTKPEYSSRLRLSEWAVKMRYGRRVTAVKGYDLDWITPTGWAYIDKMLAMSAVLRKPPKKEPKAIEVIGQLLADDPTLRQVDIVRLTGLSKMTVHRNLRLLGKKVTSNRPSAIYTIVDTGGLNTFET
ncbi:hypothetical protein [Rhizobium sp. BR 362]|uniref:hypothetical protein n=1 Tax=Rhizobium sp. BR 362 TaxID=3040670 RepID=UPI002F427676